MLFIIVLALWFGLPALDYWLLSDHPAVALLSALPLLVLVPIALALVIVRQSLYPPWYRPGTPPRRAGRRNNRASSPGSLSDGTSEKVEAEFERAVEEEDDVGTLGVLVGAAVQYYDGKVTNPLVDFGLPFRNVTIHCKDNLRLRGSSAAEPQSAGSRKRKSSDSDLSLLPSSADEYQLRGWLVPCDGARTVIVLVHGAGRDRRTWMRHVPIFHSAGYACLLLDCREHGLSSRRGLGVGFTTREALDVVQAVRFARRDLSFERVVTCGTSQGGASCIIGSVLAEELVAPEDEEENGEGVESIEASARNAHARHGASRSSRSVQAESLNSPHPSSPSHRSPRPSPYLVSACIAENPFASREACLGDLLERLLGRLPAWAAPLRAIKAVFVTAVVLVLRWQLGLDSLWRPAGWARAWQRAGHRAIGYVEGKPPSKPGQSPSASIRPLPPLWSPESGLSDLSIADLNAIDVVDRIAPRPLLLMHGLADEVIKPTHAQMLYDKARDPKKLWLVADAKHTALVNTDREGFSQTVLQFLSQNGL